MSEAVTTTTNLDIESRLRERSEKWLALWMVCFAVATAISGMVGFTLQYFAAEKTTAAPFHRDVSLVVYKTAQLFLLNSGADDDDRHPGNWWLTAARYSAVLLFMGVSYTVMSSVLRRTRDLSKDRLRDHTVLCGLGAIGLELLDDLDSKGKMRTTVIIERDGTSPGVDFAHNLGAVIVLGDGERLDILRRARIHTAREVFLATGSDSVNLKIIHAIESFASKTRSPHLPELLIHAHITDLKLADNLQQQKLPTRKRRAKLNVFNVSHTAIVNVAVEQLWPFAPKSPDDVAHYVIFGFGEMGQALTLHLAQLGHFANHKRCRFTIVDQDIAAKSGEFLKRFPRFCPHVPGHPGVTEFTPQQDDWADQSGPMDPAVAMAAEAIQYVTTAKFVEAAPTRWLEVLQNQILPDLQQRTVKPVLFCCDGDEAVNFGQTTPMRDLLDYECRPDVPIFVWLARRPELVSRLGQENTFAFGDCRSVVSASEITRPLRDEIGFQIHTDYFITAKRKDIPRAGGDQGAAWELQQCRDAEVDWDALTEVLRESNRQAADHAAIKLATLGYRVLGTAHRKERKALPIPATDPARTELAIMEHNRWVAERLLAGWAYVKRDDAKSKDTLKDEKSRKLNSNLVPWQDLPEKEQSKDHQQVITLLDMCRSGTIRVVDIS